MIGKAIWNRLFSGKQRRYCNYSYDELVAEAKRIAPEDESSLNELQLELSFRRRLRIEKRHFVEAIIASKLKRSEDAECYEERSDECTSIPRTPALLALADSVDGANQMCGKKQPSAEPSHDKVNGSRLVDVAYTDQVETTASGEPSKDKQGLLDFQIECRDEAAISDQEVYECRQLPSALAEADIKHLGLTIRTYNGLRRNAITTIGELSSMSDETILGLKGLGGVALKDIRTKIPGPFSSCLSSDDRCAHTHTASELSHSCLIDCSSDNNSNSNTAEVDLSDLDPIEGISRYSDILHLLDKALSLKLRRVCFSQALRDEKGFILVLRRVKGETLSSIGDSLGLSRERVRQICGRFERRTGISIKHLQMLTEELRMNMIDEDLRSALDADLTSSGCIGANLKAKWFQLNNSVITLLQRVRILRQHHIPMPMTEVLEHIQEIESGKGNYGGAEYWEDLVNLRFLLWGYSYKLGSLGCMPKQVELPRLLSRYIQKSGGQRKVASQFGLSYSGPIGTRNRSFWSPERIINSIRETQAYFGLPENIMPEQSQLIFWLDKDEDDTTKGPSCIAAIKRNGTWEMFCNSNHLRQYITLETVERDQVDEYILRGLWERLGPFMSRAQFLDIFSDFMSAFWNSTHDPHRYSSLIKKATEIANLLQNMADSSLQRADFRMILSLLKRSSSHRQQDDQDVDDIARFADLLF